MTEQPARNVVVFCVDAPYLLPCAFMVDQLAADPSGGVYDVVVVQRDIDDATAEAFRTRAKRPVWTIAFRGERVGEPHDPQARHVSRATYLRLYLDDLLPAQYERILYLDTDMYFERHETARLFEIDLQDAVVAAAVDVALLMEMVCPDLLPEFPRAWRGPEGIRRSRAGLGLAGDEPYCNSGAMLIDRAGWRAAGLCQRALAFLEASPERCLFADQSALNMVLAGHSVELSPRYNFQPAHAYARLGALFEPVIRHFCGPQKPWNSHLWPAEISSAYQEWLRSSEWPGPFPAMAAPQPEANDRASKKRARRFSIADLRRRLGGHHAESTASRQIGHRAFAAALLGGIGYPEFIDFDEKARRAFRDASPFAT